ncbi:MAG: sugar isomerase [Bacteroidota bacterium]|nr:sugar isomerase [Bacteroidota bacterium]
MTIDPKVIPRHNAVHYDQHQKDLESFTARFPDHKDVIEKIRKFQIAIPSWALGTGGTRFGRFPGGGEPRNLEEKLEDIGLLHSLNRGSGAVSLHIPWDIPSDTLSIKRLAKQDGLRFDAMNSNTFQDQPGQKLSYKFGSLQHVDKAVRQQAIRHNLEVIKYGKKLGSKALTVWLSDGSSFPGQLNFREAWQRTFESLQEIYSHLPSDWKIYVEYKAYEPNFYSMTVGDWGQSYLFSSKLGPKAYTLVDLGHHLPNANIEQIVSLLLMEGKLGGFHFNDSKYGDDDLTVGSIKPYQLFLIFNELVEGMDARKMEHASDLAWMIDASHNVKDPLEDLLQSVEAIRIAYAQSLLVDRTGLKEAQQHNDVVACQEILQSAFRTDVRPLVAEARLLDGGALAPLELFRKQKIRQILTKKRGKNSIATGL